MRLLLSVVPLAIVACAAAPPHDARPVVATPAEPPPPPVMPDPPEPAAPRVEPPHETADEPSSRDTPAVALPPPPIGTTVIAAKPVAFVAPSPDDPLHGIFSLADATVGLKGAGPLVAVIDTSLGALTCRLLEAQAPRNVANFVGLARGLRPFRDSASLTWGKRPVYDGTTFHRVVRGFMIQGGDPTGTGKADAGYVVPDEIWANGAHDRAGLLCTANRGPNTNGLQFFVTDGVAPHLDGNFTIFGVCAPVAIVHQIAATPVTGEHPTTPVRIRSIRIRRDP